MPYLCYKDSFDIPYWIFFDEDSVEMDYIMLGDAYELRFAPITHIFQVPCEQLYFWVDQWDPDSETWYKYTDKYFTFDFPARKVWVTAT